MNQQAIFAIIITVVATVGLGLFFVHQKESRLQKFMPYLISIGTGMLITLFFTEFLPHSLENTEGLEAPVLFLVGIWIVILAEKYLAPLISIYKDSNGADACCDASSQRDPRIPYHAACSSLGCILICAFFDGFEISTAFAIGDKAGLLVSSGMILHVIPEGALAASVAISGGFSKRSAHFTVILVGVFLIIGAAVSSLASYFFNFHSLVLPIAAGVLLYVAIGHLLPVAIKVRGGLIGLLIGMLLTLALSMGHEHHDHHEHSKHPKTEKHHD